MYFSEQGNVDDDATPITIFLVSFNLQSAVCSLQSANVIHRRDLEREIKNKGVIFLLEEQHENFVAKVTKLEMLAATNAR